MRRERQINLNFFRGFEVCLPEDVVTSWPALSFSLPRQTRHTSKKTFLLNRTMTHVTWFMLSGSRDDSNCHNLWHSARHHQLIFSNRSLENRCYVSYNRYHTHLLPVDGIVLCVIFQATDKKPILGWPLPVSSGVLRAGSVVRFRDSVELKLG